MHAFVEKCHYFRNDDPYRHETQHMSCTWSSRVCVQNFAVVRQGDSEEIVPRQNKQTLKYLVDNNIRQYDLQQVPTSSKKMKCIMQWFERKLSILCNTLTVLGFRWNVYLKKLNLFWFQL